VRLIMLMVLTVLAIGLQTEPLMKGYPRIIQSLPVPKSFQDDVRPRPCRYGPCETLDRADLPQPEINL
jgi:hypothetical protein